MTAAALSEASQAEAERQLAAAVERHLEAVSSMQALGRSEAGQRVAIKVLGRAVELVSYALRRAAAAGVPFERLVELTGWEPDLVREGLERAVPEPRARLGSRRPDSTPSRSPGPRRPSMPSGVCTNSPTRARDIDGDPDGGAQALPAPADVEDLHDRFETAWQSWREDLARREP